MELDRRLLENSRTLGPTDSSEEMQPASRNVDTYLADLENQHEKTLLENTEKSNTEIMR